VVLFDCITKRLATCALGYAAVQPLVQAQIQKSIPVGLSREGIHAGGQLLELETLLGSRGFGESPGGLGLQRLPDDVVTPDVLFGGDSYSGAGAGTALEQSFEFEPQKRLGNRQQAHTELAGELSSRDYFADRELTAQDPLAQYYVRLPRQTHAASRVSPHTLKFF
jgi:hypothetical protein